MLHDFASSNDPLHVGPNISYRIPLWIDLIQMHVFTAMRPSTVNGLKLGGRRDLPLHVSFNVIVGADTNKPQ